MAEDPLQAAFEQLSAAPLERFTDRRTELVRELKANGERAAAEQLAKAAKPSPPAWALNWLAREDPATIDAWLQTADALREASVGASAEGGDALRAAMRDHRGATERVLELLRTRARPSGRPLSAAMVERARALLQAATADPSLAERLVQAAISETPQPSAPELPRPASSGARARPTTPKPDRAGAARERRREDLERREHAALAELARQQAEVEQRRDAAARAGERLEDAHRAARRAESESSAAEGALQEAEDAAAQTRRELERLQARLRELSR